MTNNSCMFDLFWYLLDLGHKERTWTPKAMKVLTERCCFRVAWMHVDAYGFDQKHPGFPIWISLLTSSLMQVSRYCFQRFLFAQFFEELKFQSNHLQVFAALKPYLFIHLIALNTVDERHPAQLVNNGINISTVIARCLPSTVSLHLANETILNSPGLHRPLGHLSSFLRRLCRPLHLISAGLQVIYIYIYAYLQK